MQSRQNQKPIDQRIVLIGAGNAHLVFVRMWGMRPLPGVSVTLVNDTSTVPYSAMVPGHIAGEYSSDDITLDLVRICPFNGVRLVIASVAAIDPASKQVSFADRPSLGYDLLSLGLGSVPTTPPGDGSIGWSSRLRPLSALTSQLDELERHLERVPGPFHLALVGGGATGCELALAIRKRFRKHSHFRMTLIHAGGSLLPNFPAKAGRIFRSELDERQVPVELNSRVAATEAGCLVLGDGRRIPCDGVLWATDPAPPPLLRHNGLKVDEHGFLLVEETLRSVSDPSILGTGDCVSFPTYPEMPRNGVMAVRQGRVLFDNVKRILRGRLPKRFRPRGLWLALLNTTNGSAVAAYGPLILRGGWARRWKDRIDRRWLRMYAVAPPQPQSTEQLMHCGGCGSKVPGDVLREGLKQLDVVEDERVILGTRAGEDAAVFRLGHGDELEVQTVDYFKSFLDDPYLFGRVAALHALSDLHAMNARPFAALAIATVPYARPRIQSELLKEMLAGAAAVFKECRVVLAGGHTTEGEQLALGFSVTGHASEDRLFRNEGLEAGDALILTKPLGTGAILAAWMRGYCRASWYENTMRSMLISNHAAAEIFARAGVRGCSDVTGFGLAGHLLEMLDASKVSARLREESLPVLSGFLEVVARGIVSSLHEGNARVACRIASSRTPPAVLFDPQTSGGLIAGVKPDRVEEVLALLRKSGLSEAAVIGHIVPAGAEPSIIHVA
jgi:selenide,water dikinase